MNDHVARMLSNARGRLSDADVLAQSLAATSDSVSILRLLGFEVLPKAAQLKATGRYGRSHCYSRLWAELPSTVQTAVLDSARQRFQSHVDLTRMDRLLRDWEFAFTRGRYFFEIYEDYNLAQQRELGEYWESLGAPEAEADVRFNPMEMDAIIHGLVEYVQNAP